MGTPSRWFLLCPHHSALAQQDVSSSSCTFPAPVLASFRVEWRSETKIWGWVWSLLLGRCCSYVLSVDRAGEYLSAHICTHTHFHLDFYIYLCTMKITSIPIFPIPIQCHKVNWNCIFFCICNFLLCWQEMHFSLFLKYLPIWSTLLIVTSLPLLLSLPCTDGLPNPLRFLGASWVHSTLHTDAPSQWLACDTPCLTPSTGCIPGSVKLMALRWNCSGREKKGKKERKREPEHFFFFFEKKKGFRRTPYWYLVRYPLFRKMSIV